jgi:hypothetical protein
VLDWLPLSIVIDRRNPTVSLQASNESAFVTFQADLESMKFHFDIDKSIAASAYLIRKNHGKYNVLFLVKALYHANRTSLVRYGRSITGDRLVSMKNGPNVSETYDLIDNSSHANQDNLKKWKQFFARGGEKNRTMTIIGEPNLDCLSGRETQLLDESYQVIAGVRGRLDDWSHGFFPEWEEPVGFSGSTTIDPKRILEIEKKSPKEIEEIEEEIDSVNWLKSIA